MAKKATGTDAAILDLIKQVNAKKAAIKKAERPSFKTNMNISWPGQGGLTAVNLLTLTDVSVLISIVGFLLEKGNGYAEASKILEVENPPPLQWCGFGVNDWIIDIKARIGKIQITEEQRKLDLLEERLQKIVTPELRAKLEIQAITAELGGNNP